jgi:hypothetical protein
MQDFLVAKAIAKARLWRIPFLNSYNIMIDRTFVGGYPNQGPSHCSIFI